MNANRIVSRAARLCGLFASLTLLALCSFAQDSSVGTISGRVLNASSGTYLNNARVSIEGTSLQTFTSATGEFRLADVPVGTARVTVFYTGLAPVTSEVVVAPGRAASVDFSLRPTVGSDSGEVVTLDEFVVTANRETNAAAIAINEQRFAANIKNVVSSDEFGDIAEGNVGEFVKFMPGVTIDYLAADARTISVRGFPAANTPVSMDGNRLASAASSATTRQFELEQVSINNVARVEVTKSPTPDQPADTLGGAINLISKRAFERAKPSFNYRAYLSINSEEMSFSKTPGPGTDSSVKIKPSFDFTYVRPVNERFGFTLTGLHSEQFNPQHWLTSTWLPASVPGSSSAVGQAYGTAANPMLRNYTLLEGPKVTKRSSLGTTIDWKLSEHDVLTFGGDYNYYSSFFANRNVDWNVAGTGIVASPLPTYSATFTQGGATATGTGNTLISNNTNFRRKMGTTYNVNASWRHDGPVWLLESGFGYSHATNHYRDIDYGHFNGAFLTLRGPVLRFDNVGNPAPGAISATLGGAPFDLNDLRNYTIGDASTTPQDSQDMITNARFSAQRDFRGTLPIRVKFGADFRRQDRDIRIPGTGWSFVGPDGVRGTTDDLVGNFPDLVSEYDQVPYGLPAIQYVDASKLYALFEQHPEYFVLNEVALVQGMANNSRKLTETISAGYLRVDTKLFDNRLALVGGVRYERTKDDTYGVKNDVGATYVRDANGNLTNVKVSTDPVVLAQLQYQDRGTHVVKSYDDFYPSLNATFNVTDALIVRAAYARTLGRPNFNEIIPTVTQPDPTTTATNFAVINTGLRPWTANNFDLSTEFYFGSRGSNLISVGAFVKDISDFFTATPQQPVDDAFFATYGIDPTPYAATGLDYTYTTKGNGGDARISGWEVNYRQSLTFLPEWARGVQVFGNLTNLHLEGSTIADFSNFIPRSINWGVSLSRPKYVAKLNWNYRGRQRLFPIASSAANGVEPGSYEYVRPRLTLDLTGEVHVAKGASVFFAARNITNEKHVRERYGASTPDYAKRYRTETYGVQYSVGIKGTF